MHSTITAVTLHRIVSDGAIILPVEAVAIVRELWRTVDSDRRHGTQRPIPPLDQVRLRSTGELRIPHAPPSAALDAADAVESITALGTALATLLSPAGGEWIANPPQLRAIVRRALVPGERVSVSEPNIVPFPSVGDFLQTLDEFAPPEPTSDLRQLFERWHATATAQVGRAEGVAADRLVGHHGSTSTAVIIGGGHDDHEVNIDQHEAGPEPPARTDDVEDESRDDALTLFASEQSLIESGRPVTVETSEPAASPLGVQSRSETHVVAPIAKSQRAAVTVGTIAALAIAAAVVVFVRSSSEPPLASEGRAVTDQTPAPDPVVPIPTAGTLPAAPSPSSSADPDPLDRPIENNRQPTERDRTSISPVVVRSARETTAVPVIRSADLDNEPAFSPSFDGTESAMFFHAGKGGSLLKASLDGDGSVLEVTTIVDDGARNFHVRASPDGLRIAFDSDRDGERAVYVASRDGRNLRRVSGPGYAAVPAWSPDSTRLAFIRSEAGRPRVWNVWTAEIATNELQRLTSHSVGQAWGGSWFPDGRQLAYSHEDRLVVLDTVTGADRVFPSPVKGRLVRTPAVSPDGRYVVFQVFRQGTWLLDLSDSTTRRILEDPSAEEFAWSPDGRRIAFHSRLSGEWGIWMMAPAR